MENNNETRAVFINAGENRVMLNPLKGQWEHKGKKVNLWTRTTSRSDRRF
jgi:hypothetical protein